MLVTDFGEPQVGVVLAQEQSVFGAGSEHAIWLDGSFGHQVINQNTDIGLVAAENDGIKILDAPGRH